MNKFRRNNEDFIMISDICLHGIYSAAIKITKCWSYDTEGRKEGLTTILVDNFYSLHFLQEMNIFRGNNEYLL